MKNYDHRKIEKKWQEEWERNKQYETQDKVQNKENSYLLVEFPYPSGDLHTGHWYAFAVPDIYARFLRMQGKNVLFPIGFDAFGLPAENAAIKRKLNPRKWTYDNIETMKEQLKQIGASFDWSREVITCDPNYYKWTQWQFLQFLKKGLAYQKEIEVNWCPSCKTVLANEQIVHGHCERCDSEVEKREMLQWNLKITDYAERLLADLESLDWPEEIKTSQRNWIGKSEGAVIRFQVTADSGQKVEVFTTRPDTLFGATYIVLAPEHPLLNEVKGHIGNWTEVKKYIKAAAKKTDIERMAEGKEKTGVKLEGMSAINPANDEEVPVFVADYVLAGYGTGAIMAVPAHDERDWEFAKKFDVEIREVISGGGAEKEVYVGEGTLIHSGEFDGMNSEEAKQKITEHVGGELKTTYKLRDWTVSRQRYWGVPIPAIHCAKCGTVPVPDKDLPVELPEIEDYLPRDDGKSPLAKAVEWLQVACPQCGGEAERETDTLDTFVDSSWYFLRYTDPNNDKEFASRAMQDNWMPVDFYSGGAEHTTMHLLYSRFWHKALFDLGLVADEEPYTRRMNRGLILGPDGNKMSKSKGNVINPDEYAQNLGADTVRMYLAFIGPYNEVGSYPWSPDSIVGLRKFLERIVRLTSGRTTSDVVQTDTALHKASKKVGEDIATLKFNTAIAAMMTFVNVAEKEGISKVQFEHFLKLLAPFAPHLAEELWYELGNDTSIHLQEWPEYDESKIKEDTMIIAVQVSGKVRGELEVATGSLQEDVEKQAREVVSKWLEGETKKVVFVQDRLINFVL